LANSLRDGGSRPDVSGIETAIPKRHSQQFSRRLIQRKERPGHGLSSSVLSLNKSRSRLPCAFQRLSLPCVCHPFTSCYLHA
jgi:hypothetical protein